MIKAIIFDFGNVLYKFDNDLFIQRLSTHTDVPFKKVKDFIYPKLSDSFERGEISSHNFYKTIISHFQIDIPKQTFIEYFTDIFKPIKENIEVIKSLKDKYRLGLISNTNELDHKYKIESVTHLFDTTTFSYQIHKAKPHPKIYRQTLNKLGVKPDRAVYIDDIKEYTQAAENLGMKSIHYTGQKLELELQSLLN